MKARGRFVDGVLRAAFAAVRWGFDRFDRFRKTPRPFDGRLPPPERVTIETTRYCNLTCRMCIPFLEGITVTGPHLALDRFHKYADQTLPFATIFQATVSGEPLMTKGFPEMLETARKFGVKLEIVTNGSLLNDRMSDLVLSCAGRVTFSVDGADKEVFEHIRRGSDFDKIVENIRRFIAKAKTLPPHRRPRILFNCTLMERNVRQLSAIVLLAHELGADAVAVGHVQPVTDEIRAQSLIHHQELARTCIDEAIRTADRVGIPLWVQALDHYVEANATATGQDRPLAESDGVVLEGRTSKIACNTAPPDLSPDEPDYEEIRARREQAWSGTSYPRPHPRSRFPKRQPPVWVCPYLWSSTYVQLEGGIRPCCMPSPPEIGNLETQTFEEIWNGDAYREMRLRLVARDPVAVCRGCQYITEVREPKLIDRWLQGCSVPATTEVS